MPFRAPKNFREWLLLFLPALVAYATIAIGSNFPVKGFPNPKYVFPGFVAALVLSCVAGYVFTKPTQRLRERALWVLSVAIVIAVLNFGIAFAACMLVMP